MRRLKILALLFIVPLFAFTVVHKYYVSITIMEYIKDKEELQITSRIFIDDMEKLIRKRYDETITLAEENESEKVNTYIGKYLKEKLGIRINGEVQPLMFLGKEYVDDMVICYLQVSDIQSIKSLRVSNSVLFDIYEEQQNWIRTKINSKNKSFILIRGNDKALLNFK